MRVCVCVYVCVLSSTDPYGMIFPLRKIYILLRIHYMCVCVCKDHRPRHQMIQNHLTPISTGALVVVPSVSPSAALCSPHTYSHTSYFTPSSPGIRSNISDIQGFKTDCTVVVVRLLMLTPPPIKEITIRLISSIIGHPHL